MHNEVNPMGADETMEISGDPTGGAYDDAILPEDYVEGQPYSIDSSEEDPTASEAIENEDDPTELPEAPETPAAGEDTPESADQPAAEQPVTGEEAPAEDPGQPAEQGSEPVGNTYKFTDTFQGMSREVEVKLQEIPTMYRKAMTADYVVRKISVNEKNARSLGYESVEDMITKVRTSLMDAEVNALLDDNVHETIARDVVNRKYAPLEVMSAPQQSASAPAQIRQPVRNLAGELQELYEAYPAMRTQELPEPVAKAAQGGKNVLSAYNAYLAQHNAAEVQRLTKENEILRQNAAAAAKAPVKGVTDGGATDSKPDDEWLKGFNRG